MIAEGQTKKDESIGRQIADDWDDFLDKSPTKVVKKMALAVASKQSNYLRKNYTIR